MSFSPSGRNDVFRAATSPRNLLALVLAFGCLAVVFHKLSDIDLVEVTGLVSAISPGQWLVACMVTAASFTVVGQYDALFHRWLGTGVGQSRAIKSGAAAIALAQTLGLGLATGTLARWRSLPELRLTDALKVTNYVSFSFMAALGLISALALFLAPGWHDGAASFAGLAILAVACAFYLSLLQPNWLPIRLPPIRLMLRLTSLAALDLLLASLAMWVLVPGGLELSFAPFFAAFVIALGAGLLSGAPGGVGPFELCLIAMLPTVPEPELVAAILGFRLVYYALPACIAILVLARPGQGERLREALWTPSLLPLCRAEAKGLSRTEGHWIVETGGSAIHVAEASQTLVGMGDPANGGALSDADLHKLGREARERNRWPALYRVGKRSAITVRRAGWLLVTTSEEAWVEPGRFSREGSAKRQLRRQLRKAEQAGIVIVGTPHLPLEQMAEVAADWAKRNGGEHGFSMGRYDPEYVQDQQVFLAYKNKDLIGFATCHASDEEWTLDLMRSTPEAPGGTMHALVTHAIEAAKAESVPRFSLASMPREHMPGWMAHLPGMATFSGLRRFKLSFAPRVQPLYFAAPGLVPLIIAAADIWLRIHRPSRGMQKLQGRSAERSVEIAGEGPQVSANINSRIVEMSR